MSEALQQFQQALNAFLYSSDNSLRQQADEWLTQWKNTPEAFVLTDNVLHQPNIPPDVQLFCAQILRGKISSDIDDLAQQDRVNLRNSILSLVEKHCNGQQALLKQLAGALATLSIQILNELYDEGSAVAWLLKQIQDAHSKSEHAMLSALVVSLSSIPDATQGLCMTQRSSERQQTYGNLLKHVQQVLQVLELYSADGSPVPPNVILDCLAQWLSLINATVQGDQEDVPIIAASSPVVQLALKCLSARVHMQFAVTVVLEMLDFALLPLGDAPTNTATSSVRPEMQELCEYIIPQVLQFKSVLKQRQDGADNYNNTSDVSVDHDVLQMVANLITTIGFQFIDQIAQPNSPLAQAMLEAAYVVLTHPEYDICSRAVYLWEDLAMLVQDAVQAEQNTANGASSHMHLQLECFRQIIPVLLKKVTMPDDWQEWNSEEWDDHFEIRKDLAPLIKATGRIVPLSYLLPTLSSWMQALPPPPDAPHSFADQPKPDAPIPSNSNTLNMEALLYALRCLSFMAWPGGHAFLTDVFTRLPEFSNELVLQRSMCSLIGSFSAWIAGTFGDGGEAGGSSGGEQGQQVVLQLLSSILKCFPADEEYKEIVPGTVRMACTGFIELSQYCGRILAQHPSINVLLHHLAALPLTTFTKLGMPPPPQLAIPPPTQPIALRHREWELVVQGLAHIINALTQSQATAMFQQVTSPQLAALAQLVTSANEPILNSSARLDIASEIARIFDRLQAVVQYVYDEQVLPPLYQTILPHLPAALKLVSDSDTHTESVLMLVRLIVKSCRTTFDPFLQATCELIVSQFRLTQHTAHLYIASEIVKRYGPQQAKVPYLGELVKQLIGIALSKLQGLQAQADAPSLLDDTFLLATRGLRYAPDVFLQPELLSVILSVCPCGCLALHPAAQMSVMSFVQSLCDKSCTSAASRHKLTTTEQGQLVQSAISQVADQLLRTLIAGLGGACPRDRIHDLRTTAISVLEAAKPHSLNALQDVLKSLPASVLNTADKESVFQRISDQCSKDTFLSTTGERIVRDALDDLCDLMRRSKRTSNDSASTLLAGLGLDASMLYRSKSVQQM